ncbi:MAG: hypothetical protein ACK4S0_13970 [Sediminibacterium sp.]
MKKIKRIQDLQQEKMRLRNRQLELEKQLKKDWKELKTGIQPSAGTKENTTNPNEEGNDRSLWSVALEYGASYISQKLAAKAGQATETRLKESMENIIDKLRATFSRKRKR